MQTPTTHHPSSVSMATAMPSRNGTASFRPCFQSGADDPRRSGAPPQTKDE